MSYEVELKFPVEDLTKIESLLESMDGVIDVATRQVDRYYSHPLRNFAETDEALRIRRVGNQNFITYKGPKVDDSTKTRREIEVPLVSGGAGAAKIVEMFESLGFDPVCEVTKDRRNCKIDFDGFQVQVALDEVLTLGKFIEIEITAQAEDIDEAREVLLNLAGHLGLSDSERRSYLELILNK